MKPLRRKEITDLLLSTLRTEDFPIGDVHQPTEKKSGLQAGWNGQPGLPSSTYLPFAILVPLTANISSGPMTDPQGDIQLPYQLTHYGLDRAQVELLADRLRTKLDTLKHTTVTYTGNDGKIQQIRYTTIGGIGKNEATDPATMIAADVFAVWLTRKVS